MREAYNHDRFTAEIVGIVVGICLIFYAFAAGIFVSEANVEDYSYTPSTKVIVVSEPLLEAPVISESFNGLDPMIEDTYLRNDIPLDYEMQMLVYGAAQEFGVPYEMALAVVEQETNYRNIMGDSGRAYGYMQIWPQWHRELMNEIGAEDLMNPKDNFRTGCAILGELLPNNSIADALSIYNTGKPGESVYSHSVMAIMERLEG